MTIKVMGEAKYLRREVGGVLLPNLVAHEVGDEKPAQVIHRVSLPFIDSELGRQFEFGGDSGSHHPFSEWRLNLLNQGIHDYRSACSGVDGIDTGIQVPNLSSVLLDDRDSVQEKELFSLQGWGLGVRRRLARLVLWWLWDSLPPDRLEWRGHWTS
ncbi:hypothetical protein Acr_24g0011980 [Actinidia rufa]|uniref:Uncharacterized protein n=1 Tax=Actinidia rufa TaxID=165716 RepID=A0A7J0GW63_9ERIC|nr:hypothetical protein Acr_24g0011980 [Actinidia rufa]